MRHNWLIALVVVGLMLGACACSGAIEAGGAAPDFTLKSTAGGNMSLSDFKGKAVILNFFASWCPPCRSEIPDFIALQKAYGGKGFTFIGVSLVNEKESRDFASKMGINYPILVDDGKASNAYGPVRSIPTTFVINKDMKVVKTYIGSRPKETFEADIKELVK
ncbi:MAG: TlpA disulfide reductase family protein [Candidatus Omnitrophota bacterium]